MAGRSLDRPVTVRLGGQLAELRNRIGATKRRIEEEECLLRDARKRLQTLRAELLQSTEQEAQLVSALGGEEAAAAAAQAAEAAGAQCSAGGAGARCWPAPICPYGAWPLVLYALHAF